MAAAGLLLLSASACWSASALRRQSPDAGFYDAFYGASGKDDAPAEDILARETWDAEHPVKLRVPNERERQHVHEKVPKLPALPGAEDVQHDKEVIMDIGTAHRDKEQPPLGWMARNAHWNHDMEHWGTEDPSTWPTEAVPLSGKVLLADDYMVEQSSDLVRRLVPGKKEGVVFEASAPPRSKPNSEGFGFYGNVIHNGSHFLMYQRRDGHVGLALSADGFSWNKTGLLTGMKESAIMRVGKFGGEMCVQYDPNASNPEQRWIAGARCETSELCLLYSSDGVAWHFANHAWGRATDTYPCVYKEGDDYTVIIRQDFGSKAAWRAIRGVQVLEGRSDSIKNLQLHETNEWYLDMYGKDEWRRRSIYALTRTKYRDMYLGLAQMYEFAYGQTERDPPWRTDYMQPYLVTSRDGKTFDLGWTRRTPLVPRGGPDDFDHGCILTAADWVTYDGYHWLYYAGWNARHEEKHEMEAKIGLIRWEQDRIVEIAPLAAHTAGHLLTRSFLLPPGAAGLKVNAKCSKGDLIAAKLLAAESSRELASGTMWCPFDSHGKSIGLKFARGQGWGAIENTTLRLDFTLKGQASLFGFEFSVA